MRNILSVILIIAGGVLAFFGARDYMASRFGQYEAARDLEEPAPPPPPPSSALRPAPYSAPALKPGETLGKLLIPRLNTELFVVEGDDAKDLRLGPGHMPGTAMPGGDGNCIIAGHRDTHFRVLKDIRKGDDIVLETREGKYLYRVMSTQVVSPKNTDPLRDTPDAELHLITCYPFYYVGSAPKRFVVQAELAGAITESAEALP